MERSPEEGLPLGLRRQGVQFKEKIFKNKEEEGKTGISWDTLVYQDCISQSVVSGTLEVTEILCSLHGHLP